MYTSLREYTGAMSVRILLAEDEADIRDYISRNLKKMGMKVEAVETVDDTETALLTSQYDLLILDRILRNEDSLLRITAFRKRYPRQKILVLSGHTAIEDRVSGLNFGADDYLSKPFHLDELVARIRALVRRESEGYGSDDVLEFGDLKLNLSTQTLTRSGRNISLTSKEFRLLCVFMAHPKKIFSKDDLISRVWDKDFDIQSNVVEAAMARLRAKINTVGTPDLIHSKRGSGYWLGPISD